MFKEKILRENVTKPSNRKWINQLRTNLFNKKTGQYLHFKELGKFNKKNILRSPSVVYDKKKFRRSKEHSTTSLINYQLKLFLIHSIFLFHIRIQILINIIKTFGNIIKSSGNIFITVTKFVIHSIFNK